jgi:hypothetical protein
MPTVTSAPFIIYLAPVSLPESCSLPLLTSLCEEKQGGQPCCTATAANNQDIHGFATRETYGSRHCCRDRCAFTAPFHPFPALNSSKQGGHFLLRCYPLSKIFPLRSTAPYVARTFLTDCKRQHDKAACRCKSNK